MVGIYKIENLINHKCYIGQSKDIYRRWWQHKNDNNNKQHLPLYKAFNKYGIENFSFEILEECEINKLSEREDWYITKYNSYIPTGYNYAKPETHWTTLSVPDLYQSIINDIKMSSLTLVEISKKYDLSNAQIQRINAGKAWRLQGEIYPLRRTQGDWETDKVIPLLKKGKKIIEIAEILNTTEASVYGYMQKNNIHTSDFRKRISSNCKILNRDENNNILHFNSIKEGAEWLVNNKNETNFNTVLCGIKRNLDKNKTYKGYFWERERAVVEE